MKVLAMCFKCADEGKLDILEPDTYVNYNEKICSYTCRNGHNNHCKIMNNKYELLYDSAMISYNDGYFRETVMNLFSCLESFQEYVIKLLLYIKKEQSIEQIEEYMKKIKSRSECREGCFFAMCKVYLDKEYFIDDKYRSLRNQVIHNGYFPNELDSKKFAKYTYELICDCYQEIKKIIGINKIVNFDTNLRKYERKCYNFDYENMIITTMLSIGVSGNDFDEQLEIFKGRISNFYKKEKIENIFDKQKYEVIE